MTRRLVVAFRRKRNGKTNYRKRLKLLKSGKMRVVVRKSLKNILIQLVEYKPQGDMVVLSTSSREIIKLGWKYGCGNTPAAYLTGLLFARKALKKVKEAVLDFGLHPSVKGSRIYAALKGMLDAGLAIPHSEENLPNGNRLSGKHIVDYSSKGDPKQFSGYAKKNVAVSDLPKNFEEVKARIMTS